MGRRGLELRKAGVLRRYVAVLLDAVFVLFPLALVMGLMNGGGHARAAALVQGRRCRGEGDLAAPLGRSHVYVIGAALTGATLGQRRQDPRVDEPASIDGLAAIFRNILRRSTPSSSTRAGRSRSVALAAAGDRVAHTARPPLTVRRRVSPGHPLLSSAAVSKVCASCGKKPSFGNNRSHSMVATRRRFNPNLQKVRVLLNGVAKRAYICTKCLKAGKVQKAV